MKVTIVGGINYDLNITSVNKIIPFDSNPSKINYSSGGVGRNIAEVLGKAFCNDQNYEIIMLGAVGKDFEGNFILKETEKACVNCSYIKKDEKYNTGKYITFNDKNNDLYVAANDMEIYDNIKNEDIEKWNEILIDSDILLIDTNLKIEIINLILSIIYSFSKKVFTIIETVSMNKITKLRELKYKVDILKTNKNEFMHLYGLHDEKQIFKTCKKIKSFHDIIITNKEKEVIYYSNKKINFINTIKTDVINSNGAGDSFTGGLIYGILNNFNMIKSIKYGNIFASLSLSSKNIFIENFNIDFVNKIYRRNYNEN